VPVLYKLSAHLRAVLPNGRSSVLPAPVHLIFGGTAFLGLVGRRWTAPLGTEVSGEAVCGMLRVGGPSSCSICEAVSTASAGSEDGLSVSSGSPIACEDCTPGHEEAPKSRLDGSWSMAEQIRLR